MKLSLGVVAFVAMVTVAQTATAQQELKASPLYGGAWLTGPTNAYLRLGVGVDQSGIHDGQWSPPGAAPVGSDPVVFFNLSEPDGVAATIAVGRQLRLGVRGEIALTAFGSRDILGPWAFTVPATAGPHADVATTVKSTALMANVAYDIPNMGKGRFEFQPYLMAGVGLATNKMGNWTRTNAAATQPSRSFEGDSKTNLAWSLGAGVSWNVGKTANGPIKMDLTYQYFALGNAQGGGTPLAGSGTESPVNPLEFDISSQVVSVGVRIPLNLR
ncbi:MAG: porin family protein [Sulfitobacter sp.]|nr:porin family protein [Sulfitobacter sp.]